LERRVSISLPRATTVAGTDRSPRGKAPCLRYNIPFFIKRFGADRRIAGVAMPIYEYRCSSCGHELEALQKFADAPLVACPSCKADALVKKVSAAGFQLKGSGWYATDFKGSGGKPAATTGDGSAASDGKPASGPTDAKADSKSEAKSETKSEAKTESKGAAAGTPKVTPNPTAST
jgi:putative FmdB family regulatory protein